MAGKTGAKMKVGLLSATAFALAVAAFLLSSSSAAPVNLYEYLQQAPPASPQPHAPRSPTPQWQIDAGGKMSFDVASIKPHPWDVASGAWMPHRNFPLGADDAYADTGGLLLDENLPVASYIVFAYKLSLDESTHVFGSLPKWANTDHFDIEARGPVNATKDQMRLMMQSLLADRFKLVVHWENKQVPVFSLVLAKPGKIGPQLTAHSASCVRTDPNDLPCGAAGYKGAGNGEYQAAGQGATMQQLATGLRFLPGTGLDRPLVDGTGLPGTFDFKVVWVPEAPPGQLSAQEVSGPSFLEALNDQMGLKLVSTTGPSDYLVIDHIEEPTPN